MGFTSSLSTWIEMVNKALDEYVVEKDTPENNVYKAMRYSLMAGGKRLRPVLALAVCELLDGDIEEVMPYACAIEMIHTYSLIHDDLPIMDNDDYRRGRLTNHKVFGEAMAVLAGDALLNYAFEISTEAACRNAGDGTVPQNILNRIKAVNIISKASGSSGMIGGQVVDLESEGREISASVLEYMHRCKTGALIKAPIMAAAVLCDADEGEVNCLEKFAENIGLAFQIKDDILDVEGNLKDMGKTAGGDAARKKSTFVTLYGLDESKRLLHTTTRTAIDSLKRFGDKASFLVELAYFLVGRKS
jgi:geranylgeranyl diphosphate synthase type II